MQPVNPVPSVDLFGPAHQRLRAALCTLLVRMGAMMPADTARLLDDLDTVLYLCERHVAHEDKHIHAVLERRSPGSTAGIDAEHRAHAQDIRELRALADGLAATPAEQRATAGRALYLRYSIFVAETLAHMAEEETILQPLLSSVFTSAELSLIDEDIVASIGPDEMLAIIRLDLAA